MFDQSGKIVLVLVLLLLILGFAAYFFLPMFKKQSTQEQVITYSSRPVVSSKEASTSRGMKDYYSKNLKINFKIPIDAKIEERFTRIDINIGNGKISVDFNGTNFENARDHYDYLRQKNHLSPIGYQEGKFDKYDYVLTTDEDKQNDQQIEKAYFIYSDYAVYIFSTSDESLYPVLNQIVQSFEYRP